MRGRGGSPEPIIFHTQRSSHGSQFPPLRSQSARHVQRVLCATPTHRPAPSHGTRTTLRTRAGLRMFLARYCDGNAVSSRHRRPPPPASRVTQAACRTPPPTWPDSLECTSSVLRVVAVACGAATSFDHIARTSNGRNESGVAAHAIPRRSSQIEHVGTCG